MLIYLIKIFKFSMGSCDPAAMYVDPPLLGTSHPIINQETTSPHISLKDKKNKKICSYPRESAILSVTTV